MLYAINKRIEINIFLSGDKTILSPINTALTPINKPIPGFHF